MNEYLLAESFEQATLVLTQALKRYSAEVIAPEVNANSVLDITFTNIDEELKAVERYISVRKHQIERLESLVFLARDYLAMGAADEYRAREEEKEMA